MTASHVTTPTQVRASLPGKGEPIMTKDAWDGTVTRKSRGLLDGSSMYRRLEIRLADGSITKVRVSRDLWNAVTEGDTVTKAAGHDPVKR